MIRFSENWSEQKGYISKTLFDELFIDGIHLIRDSKEHEKLVDVAAG